jgi:hypothetical protein
MGRRREREAGLRRLCMHPAYHESARKVENAKIASDN